MLSSSEMKVTVYFQYQTKAERYFDTESVKAELLHHHFVIVEDVNLV